MNNKNLLPLFVALSSLLPPAEASVISINNGNPNAAQYYTGQAYGEVKDSAGNNLDDAGIRKNDSVPVGALNENVNLGSGGASVAVSASAVLAGFALARDSVSVQVTDAVSNNGYVGVASQGSRTQVQFFAAQTPGQVVFHFSLTGAASAPFGEAFPRLDFLARTFTPGSGSFFDVFDPAALHATGVGNYSFTYIGPTTDPLDILFYSSAGVFVGAAGFPGAPNGADFTAFANFSNTFELTNIDLLTAGGAPITQWSLVDLANNTTVFNQDGRVTAGVPEPASLVLLLVGMTGLGLLRRGSTAC